MFSWIHGLKMFAGSNWLRQGSDKFRVGSFTQTPAQKSSYIEKPLHRAAFTYRCSYTKQLLHTVTNTFVDRRLYTQKRTFPHRSHYTQKQEAARLPRETAAVAKAPKAQLASLEAGSARAHLANGQVEREKLIEMNVVEKSS
jgi:hypothetical protein